MIEYKIENNLTINEFRQVLNDSTLGERRPVEDDRRLRDMLKYANLIVTARDNNRLVGVARSLTDFSFCTYLSDLAVIKSYQRQGIGKELIRMTKKATPLALLILLAAPKAVDYYPRIGMKKFDHCFIIKDADELI